ncbi:MAG: peptide chain release factor 2 [Clostridia bacterium]|nr:peptide chain release factor 2 [Clostridia bacterium]MBQ2327305.1 peptide chain release factor 2 [Clostridia bacterium]MBQ5812751.1 peptide chain release factor 2 [Clostridia bacterium]
MIQYDEIRYKLNDLKPQLEELRVSLALDDAEATIAELQQKAQAADFWDDPENSQKILQKIKQLQDKIARYNSLAGLYEDTLTMIEMADEMEDESLLPEISSDFKRFTEGLEEQRLTTLLSGEYDANNAMITLHAGAGGTEAQDWTQMLYRMYTRWAEKRGYKVKVLDYLDGEEAGLKNATISIEGENAYGYLKSENGIHRLVRVSPFDSAGRRQTSFSAVEVMPHIEDDTTIEIRSEDLKVDTYRSGGAGGQHVNKTESAIRITHLPTGIVVACQTQRSQVQNRAYAMQMLRSKLAEIKAQQHLEKIEDIKGVQMKIEWGSQIRSYVFMPYTLVKDHRTGCENGNIQAVMDGEIDSFITAYLTASATGKWEKQI